MPIPCSDIGIEVAYPRVHLIYLSGLVPSKKSEKIPTRNKSGKIRMHYQAQPEIDRLAEQIPPEMRDLGLLHPDIEIWFVVTHGRGDRDGKEATVLDLLVKYGVIQGDSIARCNGVLKIHPAEFGDVDSVKIKLTDTGINQWPEKLRGRHTGKGHTRGENHPLWRGGKHKTGHGYIAVQIPLQPHGTKSVYEHILIAEKALGKPLPVGAIVHHVDEVKDNNRNDNLVICQNQTYHTLLHTRIRVHRAGGNPDTDKICSRCRSIKKQTEFGPNRHTHDGLYNRCRECKGLCDKEYIARRREMV